MGRALADAFPRRAPSSRRPTTRSGIRCRSSASKGPEAELTLTANTQPAILATSVAALRVLAGAVGAAARRRGRALAGRVHARWSPRARCGSPTRFALVHLRGKFMQEAVPAGRGRDGGASSASTGGRRRRRVRGGRTGAEVVEPGEPQRRRADRDRGHKAAVDRRVRAAKAARRQARDAAAGERALPLRADEAGGRAARRRARARRGRGARACRWSPTSRRRRTRTPARVKDLLVAQVTAPVRWEESVQRMAALGVDARRRARRGHRAGRARQAHRPDDRGARRAGDPASIEALTGEAEHRDVDERWKARWRWSPAVARHRPRDRGRARRARREGGRQLHAPTRRRPREAGGGGRGGGRRGGDRSASTSPTRAAVDARDQGDRRTDQGGLDILVNNAGIAVNGLLLRLKDDDWKRTIDVNLDGAFHAARGRAAPSAQGARSRAGSSTSPSIVGEMGNGRAGGLRRPPRRASSA